jgi:hypothetical protein
LIASTDDGLVRTHDDMKALLTYAVPGATVRVFRPRLKSWAQHQTEASMGYEITIRRGGAEALALVGSYSLSTPPTAAGIIANTRRQVGMRAGE